MTQPSVNFIYNIGWSFASAKCLSAALEFGLFTELAAGPLDEETLQTRIKINKQHAGDFFDVLAALGLLERKDGKYSNIPDAAYYLNANEPTYIGAWLNFQNYRLYGLWETLSVALRTAEAQGGAPDARALFDSMYYQHPERMEPFLMGMTGISLPAAQALAKKVRWDEHKSFVDIGCAQGATPTIISREHPHLTAFGYDLPPVQQAFDKYVIEKGLSERVKFIPGDFFKQALPSEDVLIMGHILHDWDLEVKKMLVKKAYDAWSTGGVLIVYEHLIDDEREQMHGLVMSLNMLLEGGNAFNFTGAECQEWMHEAGFKDTRVEHLVDLNWMVVATKSE